jgi:hypothetical protein
MSKKRQMARSSTPNRTSCQAAAKGGGEDIRRCSPSLPHSNLGVKMPSIVLCASECTFSIIHGSTSYPSLLDRLLYSIEEYPLRLTSELLYPSLFLHSNMIYFGRIQVPRVTSIKSLYQISFSIDHREPEDIAFSLDLYCEQEGKSWTCLTNVSFALTRCEF